MRKVWRLWLKSQEELPRIFTWPYRVMIASSLLMMFNSCAFDVTHPVVVVNALVMGVSMLAWMIPLERAWKRAEENMRIQLKRERFAKIHKQDTWHLDECVIAAREGRESMARLMALEIQCPTKREAAEHVLEARGWGFGETVHAEETEPESDAH